MTSRSRVRTISIGSSSSVRAARANTSSAWNDPSWVATRIRQPTLARVTIHRAVLTALAHLFDRSGPAVAQAKTETDSSGDVSASFSYTSNKDKTQFKNLKVDDQARGATVADHDAAASTRTSGPAAPWTTRSIGVRDLDGDGEPEVLVEPLLRRRELLPERAGLPLWAATNGYSPQRLELRPLRLQPQEPGQQGVAVEIVTTDVRFEGAFGP